MKQYEELKSAHPSEIVLFRLGDFYEIFGEDARIAAPILEVVLTQRQNVPMCGIPHHAMGRYVSKLLRRNLRLAVAEQMEDPAAAQGLVKREVVRVISPGTVTEEHLLDEKSNNFIAALAFDPERRRAGIAAADITTGRFLVSEACDGPGFSSLSSELARLNPAEILLVRGRTPDSPFLEGAPAHWLDPEDAASGDSGRLRGVADPLAREAAEMVLAAVRRTHPGTLGMLGEPERIGPESFMALDRETLESLEVLRNRDDGSERGTLLEFLDRTLTPMGGRLLKQWLSRPLNRIEPIALRLESVSFLLRDPGLRAAARGLLKSASDLERVAARIHSGGAGPRDIQGLKNTLSRSLELAALLSEGAAARGEVLVDREIPGRIRRILEGLGGPEKIIDRVSRTLADDPPASLDDPGTIRPGLDPALDEKLRAAREGREWLNRLESRERETTRIPTLKIGYTSVFGYYFEVTKPHLSKVPPAWHRKQTLVNTERFTNEELKNLESSILGAEEQARRMEREIFADLIGFLKQSTAAIRAIAGSLAELDCLAAFAETAESRALTRPEVDSSDAIHISEGRHPVVECALPSGAFVPNDAVLDDASGKIIILTGPNMSGKSTYLRQTALITLMAQVGSYVPASRARIGLVDRIFTRIGSGDRLAQGQSTFMVEMRETARILEGATARSLVILDEVGRGTSTYDGISIAWAVIEHLARVSRPKVLFATHYFELTGLAASLPGVRNCSVEAREWKDSVVFLHRVVPGPADRSYGIHVAQIAGLPPAVISRAKKILEKLEKEHQSLLQSKKEPNQQMLDLHD